ncbi:MAG: hypothetical protein A2571_00795 [Candidatus Vogelbacteria bacterium RIFOXYD1_FULL_44_32]|uniref:Uncharacterized protein n=1 Tax=Candidatus Vogelbacteria bacterium RIFOXYD1_FULL_44_32 TaxID=1802438 RepID=A0A1G2QEB9_9BACT|nr:MAG: hypothetical protein A2571_00795 [Candidatus Vogelbacteria bacterium RIFOXYD1_FULL_44_32]
MFLVLVFVGFVAGAQTGGPKHTQKSRPANKTELAPVVIEEIGEVEVQLLPPPAPAQTPAYGVAPVASVNSGLVETGSRSYKVASSTNSAVPLLPPPAFQAAPPARYIAERGAMKRQYDRPQELVDGQELQVENSRADDDFRWYQEKNRHQEQVLHTYSNFGQEVLRQQNYRQSGSTSRSYQRVEGQVQRLPGGEIVGIIGGFLQH